MKRIIPLVAAAFLLLPAAALAQHDKTHGGGRPSGRGTTHTSFSHESHGSTGRTSGHSFRESSHTGTHATSHGTTHHYTSRSTGTHRTYSTHRTSRTTGSRTTTRTTSRSYRGSGHVTAQARAAYHRPRADQWYHNGQWVGRVRAGSYSYPSGWSYRVWYGGQILPALFLTSAYYYTDVGPLGLEIPPPGYQWIRFGPDLMLVNISTGAIEQVDYGVFY